MHPIEWLEWLFSPFKYEFFRNGMIAATLVGALCGLIGVVIVLKRMSYIGHGLSHSIFGGAVVSYVMGLNFYIGAGLWGFLSALSQPRQDPSWRLPMNLRSGSKGEAVTQLAPYVH